MRSNELYNEIIKNKGKKEEDWKKFANLLLDEKGNTKLGKAINESLCYNSTNELIYDILDYIIEIGRESENAKQIFKLDLPNKFREILNKETTDKNIKIKILFLIKKWRNMKVHGFEQLYETMRNKEILFPPKNFHINKQYFKNQTENEKDNSNNKYPIYNNQINSNTSSRVNNHNIYDNNKNNNNYLNNNPNKNISDNKNIRKNDGFNIGSDNIEGLYYNQNYGSLSARNNNRENDFKKINEYRVIQETIKMNNKYPYYEAKNRSYSENIDFYENNNQ